MPTSSVEVLKATGSLNEALERQRS